MQMKDAVTVSRVIPIGSSAKMDLSYRRRKPMKQIGNLAVVCARRSEVLLQVYNGQVCVYVGHGPNRAVLSAACTEIVPSEDALTQEEYPLSNLSGEFTVKDTELVTYYKEGSSVPYVSVEDLLAALDGVFDASGLQSSVSEEHGRYILYHEKDEFSTFVANWEEDTITVSDTNFFAVLMQELGGTDYNAHTQMLTEWATPVQAATFDLGKYGFDIVFYDGQLLLPFCIANLLFCGTNLYNVYFNGEAYYGQLQSEISGMSAEEWAKIRTCEWNGSEASAEMRRTTVNFLEFALDHFYGLKDYKIIGTFGEDVIAGDLRTALLSGDAATHNQAYIDLFQKTLNEMHTTLISPSFFAEANGCGVVLGTTGYSEADLARIDVAATRIPVFKTANLSVGVNLMQALVRRAAEFLGESFDVEIIEKHHHLKKDAPSGTALMLAESVNEGRNNALGYVYGREGIVGARKENELGIHAVRGGTIVGEHEVLFCGDDEIVSISHSARSKRVFAAGAVKAAKWLVGKPAGKYDMSDLIAQAVK